jgi:hypothetical protein
MNRNARDVVYVFGSTTNRKHIKEYLTNFFQNHTVNNFLHQNLNALVDNFIHTIEQELELSDPIPGITCKDQVECYNCQFVADRIDYIRGHVLGDETKPRYNINDGAPTSRFGINHHKKSANEQLQTWNMNSGRGVQMREDTQGGNGGANPYTGANDNHMVTGVEFCDQSELNTSNHVTQLLSTAYMQALNRDSQPHTASAIGNSTPASDARLLSRRIFAANENGVENGVPNYRRRLHGRNLERDVSEGMAGSERDCIVHGHDMDSLRARVEHKKIAQVSQPNRRDMRLQNHKSYDETANYE